MRRKISVYILRKELNSRRIGVVHQHGCRFIVLEQDLLNTMNMSTVMSCENALFVISLLYVQGEINGDIFMHQQSCSPRGLGGVLNRQIFLGVWIIPGTPHWLRYRQTTAMYELIEVIEYLYVPGCIYSLVFSMLPFGSVILIFNP